MDFIVAASNLRAANYDITPADRHKVLGRKETELHLSLSTLGTSEVVVPLKMVISAYYDNDPTRVARSVGSKHLPV